MHISPIENNIACVSGIRAFAIEYMSLTLYLFGLGNGGFTFTRWKAAGNRMIDRICGSIYIASLIADN